MVAQISAEYPKVFDELIQKHLSIADYSIVPLAGDASSRRYYRVVKGNQSWVLMEWTPFQNPDEFPFISIQRHLQNSQIDVPAIIGMDEQKGLFLLEDLGDLTLERRFWEFLKQESIIPFYQVTLDLLVKLHRQSLDKKQWSQCTAYGVQFDAEKFTWELNYTFKNLFSLLCPHQLSEIEQIALQKEFALLAQTLADAPQVLCHRDFQDRKSVV